MLHLFFVLRLVHERVNDFFDVRLSPEILGDSDDLLTDESTCTNGASLRIDWFNSASKSFSDDLAAKCDSEDSNLFVMSVDVLHKSKEERYP